MAMPNFNLICLSSVSSEKKVVPRNIFSLIDVAYLFLMFIDLCCLLYATFWSHTAQSNYCETLPAERAFQPLQKVKWCRGPMHSSGVIEDCWWRWVSRLGRSGRRKTSCGGMRGQEAYWHQEVGHLAWVTCKRCYPLWWRLTRPLWLLWLAPTKEWRRTLLVEGLMGRQGKMFFPSSSLASWLASQT